MSVGWIMMSRSARGGRHRDRTPRRCDSLLEHIAQFSMITRLGGSGLRQVGKDELLERLRSLRSGQSRRECAYAQNGPFQE